MLIFKLIIVIYLPKVVNTSLYVKLKLNNLYPPTVCRKSKLNTPSQNYSTVTELGDGGAVEYADAFFCFTITFRTPLLQLPLYSQYQFFLYENISKLREKGMSYNKIAQWLNKKNYLSARGKLFKGNLTLNTLEETIEG